MEMDSSGFYKDVAKHDGANFDGGQHNGRHGSPSMSKLEGEGNIPDFGGVNFDNTQIIGGDSDMKWEKSMGAFKDPTGKFTDIHDKMFYEVDLTKHVDVVGMPTANINHNSSTDCYGG